MTECSADARDPYDEAHRGALGLRRAGVLDELAGGLGRPAHERRLCDRKQSFRSAA